MAGTVPVCLDHSQKCQQQSCIFIVTHAHSYPPDEKANARI